MKNRRRGIRSGAAVFCVALSIASLAMVQLAEAQLKAVPTSEKHRVVVLTDIGGDPDDQQSFTRFLMYADQYDIEGLLATSIRIFPHSETRPPDGAPQPQYLVERVKAYGEVRDNLLKHSEGWPETDALLDMIKKGTLTGRNGDFDIQNGVALKNGAHFPLDQILGEGKDSEASMHIVDVVDRDDPRPVWVSVWGGPIELAQALWRVRNDRSQEELKRFVDKLRVYAWGHQDASGPWIQENFPGVFYIVSTGGILYSADPKLRDQEWLDTHVRFNHGPLGALCPLRNGELGEADSETYLGLIPNGLSNLEHPDRGGWGGRFKRAPGSETHWIDLISDPMPEERGASICRWAKHFQNDYQARMDWCVKPYEEANHPPAVKLKGTWTRDVKVGDTVELAATASDPDGDRLTAKWWQFADADSADAAVSIANCDTLDEASFVVPDEVGKQIQLIVEVTDDGTPPLVRYQRIIYDIK